MKQILTLSALNWLILFTACTKEENVPINANTPENENPTSIPIPTDPDKIHLIKVQAVIKIGDVIYDSIPASVQLTSWDSTDEVFHQELQLAPGVNTIKLVKSHTRYQLKLNKWGLTDEVTFTKTDKPQGSLISLGGNQTAKNLQMEQTSVQVLGTYQLQSKIVYQYQDGLLKQIQYFQKKPQQQNLSASYSDVLERKENRVERIDRFNENDSLVGTTRFVYNVGGKIINMQQASYDKKASAVVSYGTTISFNTVAVDYMLDNGNSFNYAMNYGGGNMIKDKSKSSTGAGEQGQYSYDFNINPYVHLHLPDFYLSKMSKNNIIDQQKTYSGSFPSAEPYKFEYSYDSEGYPIELIKSYRSFSTGQHLYKTRTIYTY